MTIKHSVIVIVYNHELYLHKTLSSLVDQSEKPWEVLIFDDCSTDASWEIIKSYDETNDNFKAFRNERNIGLHGNLSNAQNMAKGEVISALAGDDYFELELIEQINERVRREGVDGYAEPFIVVPNALHLYPNGRITIWDNYRNRFKSPLKERLRHGLSYRSVGLSYALMSIVPRQSDLARNFPEMGFSIDTIKGIEEVLNSKRIYYLDYAGPVYRLGSGITARTSEVDHAIQHVKVLEHITSEYFSFLDRSDFFYIQSQIAINKYVIKKSTRSFLLAFYHWLKNCHNYSNNFPWIRAGKFMLPERLLLVFKYYLYPMMRKNTKC